MKEGKGMGMVRFFVQFQDATPSPRLVGFYAVKDSFYAKIKNLRHRYGATSARLQMIIEC